MARLEREVESQNVTITGGAVIIPIWSANTIYTNSFRVDDGDTFAATTLLTNAATASCNITVVLEQSHIPPAVEGSASATWVSASNVLVTDAIVGTWRHHSVTVLPMDYARFAVSGAADNTASTVKIVFHQRVGG